MRPHGSRVTIALLDIPLGGNVKSKLNWFVLAAVVVVASSGNAATQVVREFEGTGQIEIARFAQLADKAAEGRSKGNLGAVRSALSIYYGDNAGVYPASFNQLIPKYVRGVPFTQLPGTTCASSADIQVIKGVKTEDEIRDVLTSKGGYYYVYDEKSPMHGTFGINCKQPDSKGMPWYLY